MSLPRLAFTTKTAISSILLFQYSCHLSAQSTGMALPVPSTRISWLIFSSHIPTILFTLIYSHHSLNSQRLEGCSASASKGRVASQSPLMGLSVLKKCLVHLAISNRKGKRASFSLFYNKNNLVLAPKFSFWKSSRPSSLQSKAADLRFDPFSASSCSGKNNLYFQ